jgi:hypothetical protein
MRDDLPEPPVAAACRELARRGMTGALVVGGPDGPGWIHLVEGRLVAASSPSPRARLGDRLVGAGLLDPGELAAALQLQAEEPTGKRLGALLVERRAVSPAAIRLFAQEQLLDALFEICGWRSGDVEFLPDETPDASLIPIDLAVDYALDEAARRERQWEELSELIPTLEAVPTSRGQNASATDPLEPDGYAVLASVDGRRSIRRLALDLGYGEIETARIVHRLAVRDLVDIRLPQDEIGAALDEAFASEPGDADQDVGATTEDDADRQVQPVWAETDEHAPAGLAPTDEVREDEVRQDEVRQDEVRQDEVRQDEPHHPPSGHGPTSSADISEFLRELSRLALDPPARGEPRTRGEEPGPARGPASDDAKRKKRGLFGWGG